MPDFVYGDPSSIARKLKNIVVGDASSIARDLKELWIGDANGIPRKIFSKGVVSVPTGTVNHTPGFGTASAGISFRPDGQILYNVDNTTLDPSWFTPPSTDIGASYWIKCSLLSGSAPSGDSRDLWLSLSIARGWTRTATVGVQTSVLSIIIATDPGGTNQVASGTVTLEADRS
jgi:hypothetical protein